MELKSLGLRTDLFFNRYAGEVVDRGDYLVVRTPSSPTYFWGNYLIMRQPPGEGCLQPWIDLIETEIGPARERGFMALTWDSTDGEVGDVAPFLEFGFTVQTSKVMTARSVRKPEKFRSNLTVKPLTSDEDWDAFVDIHFSPDWEYGDADSQRQFLSGERDVLRSMVDSRLGVRLGVELEGRLIADAGVYTTGEMGRFSTVATHADFRRQGACSTLVHELSRYAFDSMAIETLVMEADEDYHAAQIYESIGFVPTEKVVKLQWCDRSKF